MSTSHYSSRPAKTDKILSAWLKNPHTPQNELKKRRLYAAIWMLAGGILIMLDVVAIRFFATDAVEALVLAALTAPTALFVILCSLESRK